MRCLIPRCLKRTHSGHLLCQPFIPCLFWLSQGHQVTKPTPLARPPPPLPRTTRIRTWLAQSERSLKPGSPSAPTCLFSSPLPVSAVVPLFKVSGNSQLRTSGKCWPNPRATLCVPCPQDEPPAGWRGGTPAGAGDNFPRCKLAGRQVLAQWLHQAITVPLPPAMAKLVLTLLGLAMTCFKDHQSSYQ